MTSPMDVNAILDNLYYDLKNPVAYSSLKNLYKAAREKYGKRIRHKDVKNWFRKQSINKFKPKKLRLKRPKTVIKGPLIQLASDLADVSNISEFNENNRFILIVIDVFTKRAFARAIINKTGQIVAQALEQILMELKTMPRYLQVDLGLEYRNKYVRALLDKHKIEMFHTTNRSVKNSICERFIRSLRTKLAKIFEATNSFNYTKILQKVIKGFNDTKHSVTKFKPSNVNTPFDNVRIRQRLYRLDNDDFKGYKFEINDYCRILADKRHFSKGSEPNWTEEIFQIVSRQQKGLVPTYNLKDLQNNVIESYFMQDEIQKVDLPEVFKIEKILDKKTVRGKTFYKVRWLSYGQDADSWISEKQLA